jgi:hypothetical protein
MIERISKNEKRLDILKDIVKRLEVDIRDFKLNKRNISLLKNYYGSKEWFKDKESYENGSIPKVKAGVLSEDEVWDLLDDIDELLNEMKKICYNNK